MINHTCTLSAWPPLALVIISMAVLYNLWVLCGVQMLSTVLNVIMFEECRNQWSMSRPLLGLILLNEQVFSSSCDSYVFNSVTRRPVTRMEMRR